jgi:hypothetical protein
MDDENLKKVMPKVTPPEGISVSEWCQRTQIQLCHCCDDLSCEDNFSREMPPGDSEGVADLILKPVPYSTLLLFTAKETCSNLGMSEFESLSKTTKFNLIQLAIYSDSLDCPWLPVWAPKKVDLHSFLSDNSTEKTK